MEPWLVHCALPQPTWEGSHAVQGIDLREQGSKEVSMRLPLTVTFCFGVIEVQDDFRTD